MKTFQVKGKDTISSIYVGEQLSSLENYLPDSRSSVIITDENLFALYKNDFPDLPVISIGTGEKIKTLNTIEYILKELISLGCDRSSYIVGIGGGIVCDITGFAASVFMRGLGFGFVSTSLLSQVDASVGGKNGVNFDAYKNMVGVFNQPDFVICDMNLLQTLPKNEIYNGMAEIVKHALIYDKDMFTFLETHGQKALALDQETIFKLVADSVRIKSQVVQKDEKEAGERRKLNFGHTIGHAIEKIEAKGHGRAVSMGMSAAAAFSEQKGFISSQDTARINALLESLRLPVSMSYPAEQIVSAAQKDKKKEGAELYYVFLEKIGSARVEKINFQEMNQFIRKAFCQDTKSL